MFLFSKKKRNTHLLLNLDVSLLKKDIRCGPMAEVSCVCVGTAPGPLYAFGVRRSRIGPPWNVLRLWVPRGNLLLPDTGDTGIDVLAELGAVLQLKETTKIVTTALLDAQLCVCAMHGIIYDSQSVKV